MIGLRPLFPLAGASLGPGLGCQYHGAHLVGQVRTDTVLYNSKTDSADAVSRRMLYYYYVVPMAWGGQRIEWEYSLKGARYAGSPETMLCNSGAVQPGSVPLAPSIGSAVRSTYCIVQASQGKMRTSHIDRTWLSRQRRR